MKDMEEQSFAELKQVLAKLTKWSIQSRKLIKASKHPCKCKSEICYREAEFNWLGQPAAICKIHRVEGMVCNPLKHCACGKIATRGLDRLNLCFDCARSNPDVMVLTKKCKLCKNILLLQSEICLTCRHAIDLFHKTQHQLKEYFDTQRRDEPVLDYCILLF